MNEIRKDLLIIKKSVERIDGKQDDQLEILRGPDNDPKKGLISRVGSLEDDRDARNKFNQRIINALISAAALVVIGGGGTGLWFAVKAVWAAIPK